MRNYALLLLLTSAVLAAGPAWGQDSGRLYSMMQESTEIALQQQNDGPQPTEPVFGSDLGTRFKIQGNHFALFSANEQLVSYNDRLGCGRDSVAGEAFAPDLIETLICRVSRIIAATAGVMLVLRPILSASQGILGYDGQKGDRLG